MRHRRDRLGPLEPVLKSDRYQGAINVGNSPGVSTFLPTDLSDIAHWYDASDASTLTLSGSAVTSWDDKSGNAGYMFPPVTGPDSGTRTINGVNALDFDGSSDYLRMGGGVPINNSSDGSWTIFAVVEADSVTGAHGVVDRDVLGSRIGQFIRIYNGTVESIGFNGVTPYVDAAGAAVSTATPYLLSSLHTGTSIEAFVSGSGNGPTATPAQNYIGANVFYIGCGFEGLATVSNYFDGAIGEIIAYSRDLTGSEISQVEAYLNTKWGL